VGGGGGGAGEGVVGLVSSGSDIRGVASGFGAVGGCHVGVGDGMLLGSRRRGKGSRRARGPPRGKPQSGPAFKSRGRRSRSESMAGIGMLGWVVLLDDGCGGDGERWLAGVWVSLRRRSPMCVVLLATFGVTLVRRIVLPLSFSFWWFVLPGGVTRRMGCSGSWMGRGALRLSAAYTQQPSSCHDHSYSGMSQRVSSAKIRFNGSSLVMCNLARELCRFGSLTSPPDVFSTCS
jgi:hypothetical protein